METWNYALSTQVHACEANGVLIFLDLRRDEYFSLDRATSRLLAPVLSGAGRGVELDDERQRAMRPTVELLLRRKLITSLGDSVDPPNVLTLDRATSSLAPIPPCELADIPAVRCVEFFRAAAVATAKLRWWSIARTVESIQARRRRLTTNCDPHKAAELLSAYGALRPLYPKRYVCLFDSLAALEFLSRQGCFPKWVFGVKASPFAAHCWLQAGDCVLNDSIENVSAYTPIMTV